MGLPDTPLNRAVAAHLEGRFDEAAAGYRALLGQEDGAQHNLGRLLLSLGRYAEAEPFLEDPFHLATAALAQGRYAEGWALYESRRQQPGFWLPYPAELEWRGGPVERLAVIGEQGYGDILMFGRFVDRLQGSVTYIVPDEVGAVLAVSTKATKVEADAWVYAGSLPGLLGGEIGPPVCLNVGLRAGSGVGVCVQGRATHPNDAWRSIRGEEAAKLLALGRDLSPEVTGARDFRETAEIVAGLELVITVDTAVAHLAASLGKPTWVLLSAYGGDWRWEQGDVWYPSARLFRQPRPGDWTWVVDKVAAELSILK